MFLGVAVTPALGIRDTPPSDGRDRLQIMGWRRGTGASPKKHWASWVGKSDCTCEAVCSGSISASTRWLQMRCCAPRVSGPRGPVHAKHPDYAFRGGEHACRRGVVQRAAAFPFEDLRVIAASTSFCRAFEIDPATVAGKCLSELGNGEWEMPKLASLLRATGSGSVQIKAYEIDLHRSKRKTRNLVVNARTLDDGDTDSFRLLLAVTDVTDARRGSPQG